MSLETAPRITYDRTHDSTKREKQNGWSAHTTPISLEIRS